MVPSVCSKREPIMAIFDFIVYWLSQLAVLGRAGIWPFNKSSFTFNFLFSLALGSNPFSPRFPSDIPFVFIVKLPGDYVLSLHDTRLISYSLSCHRHLSASLSLLLRYLLQHFDKPMIFTQLICNWGKNTKNILILMGKMWGVEKRKWGKNKGVWYLFLTKDEQNQIGDSNHIRWLQNPLISDSLDPHHSWFRKPLLHHKTISCHIRP